MEFCIDILLYQIFDGQNTGLMKSAFIALKIDAWLRFFCNCMHKKKGTHWVPFSNKSNKLVIKSFRCIYMAANYPTDSWQPYKYVTQKVSF